MRFGKIASLFFSHPQILISEHIIYVYGYRKVWFEKIALSIYTRFSNFKEYYSVMGSILFGHLKTLYMKAYLFESTV